MLLRPSSLPSDYPEGFGLGHIPFADCSRRARVNIYIPDRVTMAGY